MDESGSKEAPNEPYSSVWATQLDWVVPNWPIFKALSALRGAKIAQHGLKMGSFHLFVHPK